MNMEQQVSNREFSQRLKKLGVKQESVFWWNFVVSSSYDNSDDFATRKEGWRLMSGHWEDDGKAQFCSAFTAAELLEMLPKYLVVGPYSHDLTIIRSSVWRFYYGTGTPDSVYLTAHSGDSFADAIARMLIYLLENKLITV